MPGLALPALPANKQLFKQSPRRRRRRRCRICKRRCPVKYPFTSERASIATAHHHSSFCTATRTRIGCGVPRARARVRKRACVRCRVSGVRAHAPTLCAYFINVFVAVHFDDDDDATALMYTPFNIKQQCKKAHYHTHTHITK